MKKLFEIIVLFLEAYWQNAVESKETLAERTDRTAGSEFYF